MKRLAPQLLAELATYLGDDESVEPKPKPKPESEQPKPKPKQPKPKPKQPEQTRAIAAVEPETVDVAPSAAIWRKLSRSEFAFSGDESEDAELRLLLLEAYDSKYTRCSTFRAVFDILLHAMEDKQPLPVPLARCLADRCLSYAA